jgi:hypothetical protein
MLKRRSNLSLATLLLAISCTALAEATCTDRAVGTGIPSITPDYSKPVDVWWAAHPLNPQAPGSLPIGEITRFATVVEVHSVQEIQQTIDRFQSRGVTICLLAGKYQGIVYTRGYSNIQLVGVERDGVRWHGKLYIMGLQYALPIGTKDPKNSAINGYRVMAQCVQLNSHPLHQQCLNRMKNPPRNIYVKNITFDGRYEDLEGQATPSAENGKGHNPYYATVMVRTMRDVVLDQVAFVGHSPTWQKNPQGNWEDAPDAHHPGIIEAGVGVSNVWVRGALFAGGSHFATYFDGMHGGGVIDSSFAGNEGRPETQAWRSGVNLSMTMDDFTQDFDQNGSIEESEKQNTQYAVFAGNTYGSVYNAVSFTGGNSLVQGNTVKGLVADFVDSTSKCAKIRSGVIYNNTGIVVQNNQIEAIALSLFKVFVDTVKRDNRGEDRCQPSGAPLYPRLGGFKVIGNQIGRIRQDAKIVDLVYYLEPASGGLEPAKAVCNNKIADQVDQACAP